MPFFLLATAFAITQGTDIGPAARPEVVAVLAGGTCAGSRIHPRWVLTNARCFGTTDPTTLPTGGRVIVRRAGVEVAAIEIVLHPDYVPEDPEADVALVHLADAMDGPLMELNDQPIDAAWVGLEVGLVGYGTEAIDASSMGTKRQTQTSLEGFDTDTVELFGGGATCFGDGGAPGFLLVDGDLVQLAVASDHGDCGDRPGVHPGSTSTCRGSRRSSTPTRSRSRAPRSRPWSATGALRSKAPHRSR